MTNVFINKKPNYKKLLEYGFRKQKSVYFYTSEIYNGQFELLIEVEGKDVSTRLTDLATNDLYTLHLLEGAEGTFIGQVKKEYDAILSDISEKCFETDVFEYNQSVRILEYAKEKYGSEPEYLWTKFPRNAVCRRKDNKKWFFALLSVKGSVLGLETNKIIEIVDLRADKKDVPELLKQNNIYPAYHMNKKSWITIILDGSMNINDIYHFIDYSYNLAKK